jgi:hypothetical protein
MAKSSNAPLLVAVQRERRTCAQLTAGLMRLAP